MPLIEKLQSLYGNKKGMTLMEIMAVIAIMGIIMGSAFALFHGALRTYTSSQEMVDIRHKKSQLDYLVDELRPYSLDGDNKIEVNNEINFGDDETFKVENGSLIHDTSNGSFEIVDRVSSFEPEIKEDSYIVIKVEFQNTDETVSVTVYPRN